jgi:hypothetical protein
MGFSDQENCHTGLEIDTSKTGKQEVIVVAICEWCKSEMNGSVTCVPEPIETDSGIFERVRYGKERSRYRIVPKGRPCGDCGVAPGGFHHPGCDLEECPRCVGQLFSCGCYLDYEEEDDEDDEDDDDFDVSA